MAVDITSSPSTTMRGRPSPTPLEALPNEVLFGVLAHFSATDLTRLCLVNRRFGSLVCRLLHRRLLAVASLPADDLIFECFTPAAKLSTPSLDCRYVATKTRRPGDSGVELFEPAEDESPSLDSLGRMYSVFRPVVSNDNRRPRRREDGPAAAEDEDEDEDEDDTATELAHLDADQLFEQLCAVTNVVKPGPRPGLFLSHVNISDGVLRLWRDWLADMADDGSNARHKILWVDAGQTIGLRMRVTHGPAGRMPVLSGPDDYPPISYRLEYQELFVRTVDLLWAVEKSAMQEVSHSGKAIVIASCDALGEAYFSSLDQD